MKTHPFLICILCLINFVIGFAFDGYATANIPAYYWLPKILVYLYIGLTVWVGFAAMIELEELLIKRRR